MLLQIYVLRNMASTTMYNKDFMRCLYTCLEIPWRVFAAHRRIYFRTSKPQPLFALSLLHTVALTPRQDFLAVDVESPGIGYSA